MPEIKNYAFTHTELAEILVKKLDIHEGLWGVYFEFGHGATNVPITPDQKTIQPAVITVVQKVGIQRFETPNNLTVDAAQVNPLKPQSGSSKKPSRIM